MWPDFTVASMLAGPFVSSAFQIVRQALMEHHEAAFRADWDKETKVGLARTLSVFRYACAVA